MTDLHPIESAFLCLMVQQFDDEWNQNPNLYVRDVESRGMLFKVQCHEGHCSVLCTDVVESEQDMDLHIDRIQCTLVCFVLYGTMLARDAL